MDPSKPLTPTEVNAVAAKTIEDSPVLALAAKVGVEGEVTNWKGPSKSGHFFFSIRDAGAELPLVCWAGRAGRGALPKGITNGMKIVAWGKVSIWQARGDYRLSVERAEEAGKGDLWAKVAETRRRLAEEGIFDAARKRPLPPFPRRIGIATSEAGVVLHDVATVLKNRWPLALLVLRPIPVQGDGAAAQIAAGLLDLARRGGCDVILVCRGGGSAEDLMPFHDEAVARAIRRVSEEFGIPVVTGIGHAPDHAIADDAADAYGPVPAGAAALVVPDREALLRALAEQIEGASASVHRRLDRAALALSCLQNVLGRNAPLARLERAAARTAAAREGLAARIAARIERAATRLGRARERLEDLSPLAVLSRGYALVYDPSGRLVRRAVDAPPGTRLRLRLGEGEVPAVAQKE